jgi:GNAT superfamily N-acetyltransferase
MMELSAVTTHAEYGIAAGLFRQYQAFLGVDLCFQSFEEELRTLPAMYGRPGGCILLLRHAGAYVGCVAMRPKGQGVCEMKRLYVQPPFTGRGGGRMLAEAIVQQARQAGYSAMVLDTLERLTPALSLYRSLGFEEVEAYYDNPLEGVVYMRKELGG